MFQKGDEVIYIKGAYKGQTRIVDRCERNMIWFTNQRWADIDSLELNLPSQEDIDQSLKTIKELANGTYTPKKEPIMILYGIERFYPDEIEYSAETEYELYSSEQGAQDAIDRIMEEKEQVYEYPHYRIINFNLVEPLQFTINTTTKKENK